MGKVNKYFEHFKTVSKHKRYVLKACSRAGITWQGIIHDLSKFSISEFLISAKFFKGTSSPIDAEKDVNGYSLAWLNHKGKNKHHWQYWIDFTHGQAVLVPMPPKYVIEMLCDWLGANKAYTQGDWSLKKLKEWYNINKNNMVLHSSTRNYVEMFMKNVKNEDDMYKKWFDVKKVEFYYHLDECEDRFYNPPYYLNKTESDL